ncbi:hypothetical protein SISSUDRAFT_1038066 [Sistotremastrum suecicum HHB10207 ss-3]|uniref:Uncharacterized protein n=1 Tax=Sistotremastrum suecicum HHB10207 ss-3 TaxID=1314776 RepID=A0A165X9C2_9AGAM|nr:hypothetical protein SISSUDRAFT_1038066 [Sistotremastrum suecicum HHB10207 ss-3]
MPGLTPEECGMELDAGLANSDLIITRSTTSVGSRMTNLALGVSSSHANEFSARLRSPKLAGPATPSDKDWDNIAATPENTSCAKKYGMMKGTIDSIFYAALFLAISLWPRHVFSAGSKYGDGWGRAENIPWPRWSIRQRTFAEATRPANRFVFMRSDESGEIHATLVKTTYFFPGGFDMAIEWTRALHSEFGREKRIFCEIPIQQYRDQRHLMPGLEDNKGGGRIERMRRTSSRTSRLPQLGSQHIILIRVAWAVLKTQCCVEAAVTTPRRDPPVQAEDESGGGAIPDSFTI